MIKALRLFNFKAFEDTGEIELRPITVLAGPNSGGKTSILQSLLLLKQTLESQEPDVHLKLDGRFLEVLELKELVFGKPRLTSCEIGFEFTVEIKMPPEIVPKYFPSLEVSDTSFLQSSINIIFRYKDGRAQVRCFDIRSSMNDIIGPRFTATLRGERYQVTQEGIDIPESFQGRDVIGVAFSRFLPGFLLYESGEQQERPLFSGLDRVFWNPITDLERELEQHLSYLGPLREEPRRAYLQSGSPSREIGQRGENAAQILWLEKDEKVHYRPDLGQDSVEISLMEAVKSEFQRLGINQPIDVSSAKSIVYQLIFGIKDAKGTRKEVTIADVGFGVSQLLPIVVLGLRSPKQSLLLFEQPEIHLHPKLQANLADFFLRLASEGKRILVETHSDHFINRLRRRIAEDSTDKLKDMVSILFVCPPEDGRGATIEPLRVDRYGVIENWPPDFLPESADEAEAIFRAGLEKRQRE